MNKKLTNNQLNYFNQDIFKQLTKHLTNNQLNILYKQKKN